MRRGEICRDLLVLFMKGLMYHGTVCMLYNAASVKPLRMDLNLLILYVPLLLFAVIRRKCGNFFLFLLFHILISGIFMLLFPGLEQRIVLGGCVCVMAVLSLRVRIITGDGQETRPPLSSVALFIVISLAAWQSARVQVMRICGYEAFLFLISFVIHRNLTNLSEFLNENETMDNFPKEQMKAINHLLLGIFVLCFMAGMLFLKGPSGYLLSTIGVICRELLRIVVKILAWIFQNNTQQPESMGQGAAQEAIPAMEAGEASSLALLLEKLIIAGTGIVLAAAAVYFAARFLYRMYQRFYEQHKEPDDESEFIWKNTDLREKTARKPNKQLLFPFGNPSQKIRRMYKKSIVDWFHARENIPAEMTPMELEFQESVCSDSEKLNKVLLYEKARYSQHPCDKKEVEQMKQYIKSGH